MKMNNNIKIIGDYLDEMFPNPKPELIFHSDYELLLAVMLSAQTTDKRVNTVTAVMFNKYPNLEKLMDAEIKDLENIIHPLGSFRKKAQYTKEIAKIIVEEYNGVVPTNKDILTTLPGIGRKTANVFLSEFYGYPAIAVDTHVERVSKRLGFARINDSVTIIEKKLMKKIPKDKWNRVSEQILLFGRYYCTSKNPKCLDCKFKNYCKYKKNS